MAFLYAMKCLKLLTQAPISAEEGLRALIRCGVRVQDPARFLDSRGVPIHARHVNAFRALEAPRRAADTRATPRAARPIRITPMKRSP